MKGEGREVADGKDAEVFAASERSGILAVRAY